VQGCAAWLHVGRSGVEVGAVRGVYFIELHGVVFNHLWFVTKLSTLFDIFNYPVSIVLDQLFGFESRFYRTKCFIVLSNCFKYIAGDSLLLSRDRIARVQRALMEQPWWGSPPWTWQDKGGRLDAQDGWGCACALGRGSPSPRPVDPS